MPEYLTAVGNTLYFTADDGTKGAELWTSDGSEAGTGLVKDIHPGAASSNPRGLAAAFGRLFFTAATTSFKWEGLPSEIDTRYLEILLFMSGCAAITKRVPRKLSSRTS